MTPRRAALQVLSDVLQNGAYANLALKSTTPAFEPQQARWISSLVYTTLDHLLTIDYYLSHCLTSPCKPAVRHLLRLGCCELLYMHTPAHAVINEYVALCKSIGKSALSGFVNAVLRRIDRERDALPDFPTEPVMRLSVQYSFPEWIVRMWLDAYGEAFTEALLAAPPAPMELRAQYPCSTKELLAALPRDAVCCTLDPNCIRVSGLDPAAQPSFLSGEMSVQSLSAMLCCRALGDCRKKRVLDACAAPGGKSAYLASLCENDVALTCWELHPHRVELLRQTLSRLHVDADIERRDASVHDPAFDGAFDAVLLDAPCSGLGQVHDKPDIRYAKSERDIARLANMQARLLDACAPYVRPGGTLLYATCTIARPENEEQAVAFLARHPEFTTEKLPLPIENEGMLQLFPNVHDTDGFFLARFVRCS